MWSPGWVYQYLLSDLLEYLSRVVNPCSFWFLFELFFFFFLGSNQIHGLLVTGSLLDQCSSIAPQRAPLAPKENLQPQCAAADTVQKWVQPHVAKPHYRPASTFHSFVPNHKERLRVLPLLLGAGPCTALQLFAMDINKLLMPYINEGRNCTLDLKKTNKNPRKIMNTWIRNNQIINVYFIPYFCCYIYTLHLYNSYIYFICAFSCILIWRQNKQSSNKCQY